MTVRELMEKLAELPPYYEVNVPDDHTFDVNGHRCRVELCVPPEAKQCEDCCCHSDSCIHYDRL